MYFLYAVNAHTLSHTHKHTHTQITHKSIHLKWHVERMFICRMLYSLITRTISLHYVIFVVCSRELIEIHILNLNFVRYRL